MPVWTLKRRQKKVGKPILFLNHHFGEKDLIFDSGVRQASESKMNGLLKFFRSREIRDEGTIEWRIRVEICSDTILNGPKSFIPDRFSRQAVLDIPKPGWYPHWSVFPASRYGYHWDAMETAGENRLFRHSAEASPMNQFQKVHREHHQHAVRLPSKYYFCQCTSI